MDYSAFLPREKYGEVAKAHGSLPTLEIEKGGQVLYFFGSNHSHDPKNPQYAKLKKYWSEFLSKTNQHNRIVLVEGRLRPVCQSEKSAVKEGGENGLLTLWASRADIEIACPDVPDREEFEALAAQFSKDKLLCYYFVLSVDAWQRRSSRPDFDGFVQKNLNRHVEYSDWSASERTIEYARNIFERLIEKPFIPEDRVQSLCNPNKMSTIMNQIARVSSDLRDRHIASEIERYWDEGKSIFVVFGSGHLIIEEPALKAELQ